MNAGKVVTMGILTLAMGLAAFAWSYHRNNSDLAVDYWGPENALMIRRAPTVELMVLEAIQRDSQPDSELDSTGDKSDPVQIDERSFVVSHARDMTSAKGLVHLRQALVQNSSLGPAPAADQLIEWEYLLCFRDTDERSLEIALSLDQSAAKCLDGRETIGLRIAEGIRTFLDDPSHQLVEKSND